MDNRRENGLEFYEKEVGLYSRETSEEVAPKARHRSGDFFTKASVFFYALAVFLMPFVFIPAEGMSLQASKVLVVAFFIVISGIAYLYSESRREILIPRTLFLFLGLLSTLFILSTLFSESFNASFLGGFQGGSLYVLLMGVIAAALGGLLISTPGRFLILFASLLSGASVLALVHLTRFFLGPEMLSFGLFTSTTSTPAGSWYDLGALFAVVYLLTLTSLVFGALPARVNLFLTALLFLSLFFLAITHLTILLIILIVFSIVIFILALKEKVPTGKPLILAVTSVLILFVVFAGPLNGFLGRMFGTEYVEVRPSWQSTVEIARTNLSNPKNFLMGNGPNTFSLMWQDDRNQDVVESNFWSLDFSFGTSTFVTYVMTLGILMGVLLILWFFYLLILLLLLKRDTTKIDTFTFMSLRASLFMSLFILLFGSLYVFGVIHFFLLCIFSGVSMGAYARLDPRRTNAIRLETGGGSYVFGASIFILSLVGVHLLALGTSSVVYGQTIRQMAVAENPASFDSINSKLRTARFLNRSDLLERARAESALLEMQLLSSLEESEITDDIQNRFVRAIEAGKDAALAGVRIDPRNYLNWVTGGYVFETLGELGVEGGHDQAARFYAQARTEHPTNPEIPLIQARLEFARDDSERASVFARESIDMKKTYDNAYTLLAQIELESGGEARALAILEEGVRANPNSQILLYELGALHYKFGNFNRAIDAFGRAIEINPAYANALYFRGLAFYQIGDRDASLADLEKVLATNENNQDLVRVVNNVRANRDPLMGLDQSGEGSLPRSDDALFESNASTVGGSVEGERGNSLLDTEEEGLGVDDGGSATSDVSEEGGANEEGGSLTEESE